MAVDVKPLFRPEAVRPQLAKFHDPDRLDRARTTFAKWAKLLASKSGAGRKETELLPDFLRDVFVDALGYVPPPAVPYTIKREALVQVDGKFADAAIGRFEGEDSKCLIMLEGKGPKDPLDRPFAGRKRSAVEQALQYAVQERTDWYIVTNLVETRLYHKGNNTFTFEAFETSRLGKDEAELKRFVYLLGAERVLAAGGNHLDKLLTESARIGRELTNEFYGEYRVLREQTFNALRRENPERDPAQLLAATQKILDRVLFVAFCEDRGLLPQDSIKQAYEFKDKYAKRPVWDNFKSLFEWVNVGNDDEDIPGYNGGLFKPDVFIDSLSVPNDLCEGFKKIADYHYGTSGDADKKLIDVDILGHIFEQSISDLEEMQNILAGRIPEPKPKEQRKNSRKEKGAFYTPAFITRYIVEQALGGVLDRRREELRAHSQVNAPKALQKCLNDPAAYELESLNRNEKKTLAEFWRAWHDVLKTIRLLDPACGSGAFLIEAFDQLFREYDTAQKRINELEGNKGATLFDISREILEQNLFGVDLNGEAVEIARLSCWIKTAERHKVLTNLDRNIQQGNSVVSDPAVHPEALDWRAAFPHVFAAGGFDVVVGNPPYVRQEWIKEYKPHWEKEFESYASSADLFVYFYELAVKLLKPGGRLGYITSGGWVRGNYGEGIRGFLAKNAGLDSMIDFGEYQPFEDAEMIRPTILIASKRPPGGEMKLWKWLTGGKPPENLSSQIDKAPMMRTDRLARETWELETDQVISLRKKLCDRGKSLLDLKISMFRGVTTGLDSAFVISQDQAKQLINKDKRSEQIIKPFVQGGALREWYVEEPSEWLIFARRGIDIEQYPAVKEHLQQFRDELEPRNHRDDGSCPSIGRKAGTYKWFEIQDVTAYWQVFEKPMLVWPDITNYPRFSQLRGGVYVGATGFVIPTSDYYLLAVLSSWASWFFISKTAQPLRLRSDRWQYRLKGQYMENVPIPDAPPSEREAIAKLAELCNTLGTERYRIEQNVRHRLLTSFRVDAEHKLNEKAEEWWNLDFRELGEQLKKSFKRKQNPLTAPKTADEWEPYWKEKRAAVEALRRKLADAEAEINDRVYKLFDLTKDEIQLLQREVEH